MADVLRRASEACDADPSLLWDTVWKPAEGQADWALAGSDEPQNRGGLSSKQALATAVALALFTDCRVPEDHPLSYLADGDRRGWWGDAANVRADLGETALGSMLWLLERAPLTVRGQSIAEWAKQFAIEALMPLKTQGAIVRMDVSATANETRGRLELLIRLFGRDGANVYDQKFELIWRQIAR